MDMDSFQKYAIGIFDSGVGGLTVMRQLSQRLPAENMTYFGDTARLPYGNKSKKTITQYSIENAIFLVGQRVKLLVIACHTASSHAGEVLKQIFKVPTVDVIEPAVLRAVGATRNGRIAVLGTKGTILSGVYQQKLQTLLPKGKIFPIACPLWVHLVEERFMHHPASRLIVREYLQPLKEQEVDTILLGCTHYPLLRTLIEEEVGPDVLIVDPAETCAEQVVNILDQMNLHAPTPSVGMHQYFVSDDPDRFRVIGEDFLGHPLPRVEQVVL